MANNAEEMRARWLKSEARWLEKQAAKVTDEAERQALIDKAQFYLQCASEGVSPYTLI
jgi:hypothetical protein